MSEKLNLPPTEHEVHYTLEDAMESLKEGTVEEYNKIDSQEDFKLPELYEAFRLASKELGKVVVSYTVEIPDDI